MAARKSTEENRSIRRALMVNLRKRGLSFGQIGMKMGVSKNTARVVVLRMLGGQVDASRG
jgi:orotate phosphoribosyltransferase-like protein